VRFQQDRPSSGSHWPFHCEGTDIIDIDIARTALLNTIQRHGASIQNYDIAAGATIARGQC
jgi:hypothetical protein